MKAMMSLVTEVPTLAMMMTVMVEVMCLLLYRHDLELISGPG